MVIETLLKVAPEVQVATLDPSTNFRDQLDFDSLDFLNFALALEKRFGLKIPEGEYPRLSSLDGCLAYLRSRSPSEAPTTP